MSESILKAIIQLFAIISNVDENGVSKKARSIVDSVLKPVLSYAKYQEYIKLFESYVVDFHNIVPSAPASDVSVKASSSVRTLRICNEVNKSLNRREKFHVLIKLLEFIDEDDHITESEIDFVETVSQTFNISDEEFNNLKYLYSNEIQKIKNKSNILLINNEDDSQEKGGAWFAKNEPESFSKYRKIYRPKLVGSIWVLYVPSIKSFAFKYSGYMRLELNNRRIVSESIFFLEPGAIIKGGDIIPIYFSDIVASFLSSKNSTKLVFNGENLEFNFKGSRNGIKNFSFSEESGNLIGIMGGSGVGKSTLFNLLNGSIKPKKGTLTINGYNIHSQSKKIEGIIGYVPQDDLLIEELTVFENLYYSAKLCFGNFPEKKIINLVNRILVDLGLFEIKHLTIGSPLKKYISGGQRKRLNIALELIREPSILFVDEPTSGLSSSDSETVMFLLKEQVQKGKLVVVNIHQPSSDIFKLFDKLWILDKGGRLIYNGNPIDAISYFKRMSEHLNPDENICPTCGNINPEQILNIIEARVVDEYGKYLPERKISPEQWYNKYKENIESKLEIKKTESKIPKNHFKIPDLDKQFWIYSLRNLISKFTNKQYLLITFLEAPLLAFVLSYLTKFYNSDGYAFSENKNFPSYLLMSVIVALFLGLIISAEEIIRDRKILKREEFLNLSRFSYINSKILYLFLLSAVQTLTFVLVGNYFFELKGMWWQFWLILFSTSAFANIVGLNISSGLNSVVNIYILIPFILVPQILLSGVIVSFDDLNPNFTDRVNVPIIGDMVASRWAFEALAVEEFKNNKYEKYFYKYEKAHSDASFRNAYLIPNLESRLDENLKLKNDTASIEKVEKNFQILKNEIKKLWEFGNDIPFGSIKLLNSKQFTEEVAQETKDYLQYMKFQYSKVSEQANAEKDRVIKNMIDTLGTEGLLKLKQENHNKRLADYLLNAYDLTKIYEIDGELIQKKDPIFMYPTSKIGRAHFYSPVKMLGSKTIDTLWFNVAAIWAMIFIAYNTLLMDLIRVVLTYFEDLRLRWQEK